MFDVAIRGGTVVDGTGAMRRQADVGIVGSEVRQIGRLDTGARSTIDATGCIVAPGFVDPHTHLDAQLCWDPAGTPTNAHGVTTVLLGLCGFGVAPCPPGGGDYLLRMLEGVEEIPIASTRLGVEFSWGSWPDYIRSLRTELNVYGFVPHSALRYAVMGDRARGEAATDADIGRMVEVLSESLSAGAVGFASSRGPNHVDGFGDPVPSRFASDDEVRALVGACRGRVWQMNLESKAGSVDETLREIEQYAAWTAAAGARFTWTPFLADPGDQWKRLLENTRDLNARGIPVKPQVGVLPISVVMTFGAPSILSRVRGWSEALPGYATLDAEARVTVLRDEDVRARLRTVPEIRDDTMAPHYDEWLVTRSPSRPAAVGRSVRELGQLDGRHPVDVLCDLALADGLDTAVQLPVVNRNANAELLSDADTVIGLGDSGAHVTSIAGYSYPTALLARVVRDAGAMPLELAVHRLTQQPAEFYGLTGRGVLAPGRAADIVVFDLDRLELHSLEMRDDLPGRASRLWRGAEGYRSRLVNGAVLPAAP